MIWLLILAVIAQAKPIWIFGLGSENPIEINFIHTLWSEALNASRIPLDQAEWIAPLDGPRALKLKDEISRHPENTYILFFMGHGVLNPMPHAIYIPHSFISVPQGHNLSPLLKQLPSNVSMMTLIAPNAELILKSLYFGSQRKSIQALALESKDFSSEKLTSILDTTSAWNMPSKSISVSSPQTHFMAYIPDALDLQLECLGRLIVWVQTVGPASIRFSHAFQDFPPIVQKSDLLIPIYISIDPIRHSIEVCHLKQTLPIGSNRPIYKMERKGEHQSLAWPIELR